jgi:OmcA/MtrC family decaheme c-type cytochrome
MHVAIAPPDPNATYLGGTNANTNAACVVAASDTPPVGANVIAYVISSVTVTNNHPSITFKLTKDAVDVVFNTYSAATSTGELMAGFVGSPSVYFAWSEPQDGIAAPADFNVSASGYIRNVNNKTASNTTISGPDGSGYYTITLTGVNVSASSKMLTGGVGYSYSLTSTQPLTQISGYTISAPLLATYCTYSTGNKVGGLLVPALDVSKVASGFTARRAAVDTAKCNACHGFLGVSPTFHAGQRNDAPTCAICHTPNRTSSGWSANASTFVHGIHAAAKRTVPFNWHAVSATENFSEVTYPLSGNNSGLLRNCEACHVAGYYDYSASAYTANGGALMNNLLFSTVATGTLASSSTSSFAFSPYVTLDNAYGSGFSFSSSTGVSTPAAGTTLVTSPISAACFACHDSIVAKDHMKANGGSIYEKRSIAIP